MMIILKIGKKSPNNKITKRRTKMIWHLIIIKSRSRALIINKLILYMQCSDIRNLDYITLAIRTVAIEKEGI